MQFGSEVWLVASWGAGALLMLSAGGWTAIRRRMARRPDTAEAVRNGLNGRDRAAVVPKPFTGKVFVIDGDTIQVRKARIRLFGMDAPELSQQGGAKARSHLIGMAGGKEVSVQPVDVDCYGRIVARVRMGEIDLSEQMVLDGFAVAMRSWHPDYIPAERFARHGWLGLWAGGGIGDPSLHRRQMAAQTRHGRA